MSLIRSAATVGGLTMASRVLGFVRDVLMASVLGTGLVADAFVVAFRFPNLFRRLFGEGAFNAAFVPLFAGRLEGDGEKAARRFAEEILAVLFVALLGFVALAMIAMPLLIYVLAPGFVADPAKFDLTVTLTRIAFPYLLFMSLVALLGGILNTLQRFAMAAAAPVLLNLVLISALVIARLMGWGDEPATGMALAWGVALAGLVQFVLLWVSCRNAGMRLKLRRPTITPGVRRLVQLGIPGVIAGGIMQLNLVVSTIIASMQASAPSWLYYADRVYQLPLGVVGVAIGIVLLPELSRRLRAGDEPGVQSSQNRALEFALFLTAPASVALMVIPYPIVQVLFERGAFEPADTTATALALAAFAAGLPAFVLQKIFQPGFFAREDTRTPMNYALASVALNIAGALALFPLIGHIGIALATSAAAWLNAGLLWTTLRRRGHFAPDPTLRRNLPRIVLSSLVMGGVVLALALWWQGWFSVDVALTLRIGLLLALIVAGAAAYFALTFATGAFRPDLLKRALRRAG
ncbi:MAG: murein biosynthesis integral membrane protein MurJ [Hyphomicrobiales bacterium]